MKKNITHFVVPLLAVILSSLLAFSSLDYKTADYFQRVLKSTPEDSSILMLKIDDDAVSQIGTWPFSRSVYADMLNMLKELGAQSVVFDLSFLDKSQATVDEVYVKETLPVYVEDYFSLLSQTAAQSFDALSSKTVTAQKAFEDYDSESKKYANELNSAISHVVTSVDDTLAKAIKFFDNTYLTLTFENNITPTPQQVNFLENYIALDNVVATKDTITKEYTGVQPALYDFITQSACAGFVNADPDKDGYLRHLNLVVKYNERYYAQLVLAPILKQLGNPTVEITNKYIKAGKLKIPRSRDGSVIIKYPKKLFSQYNSLSLANIHFLTTMESTFIKNLNIMSESGFFDDFDDDENPYELYETALYILQELADGERTDEGITYSEYLRYRQQYFSVCKEFLTQETSDYYCSLFEEPEDIQFVHELFEQAITAFTKFSESYEKCRNKVANAMCIVGTNSSSTTDYGINQYQEHYPNPGVHYALANMILANDFVDDSPVFISIFLALVICVVYSLLSHKLKRTDFKIALGIVAVVLTAFVLLLYFVITRQYIGTVIPVTAVLLSFVVTTVTGFITANNEKKFITNAFSQCLSKEVVSEIVENPSSFKLGGQKIQMSAMFTDIQKFSGFSELLTPGQLVALLNYYLTRMSEIIMNERGTIDKYEGDAIIALVGAPVQMEDHAQRACAAAIKMKVAENVMNQEIANIVSSEKPADMDDELYEAFAIMVQNNRKLFTRIGINSGEMIAGYMGSENKKNYTMMGNNVNLASRLEGVNKQYSTGGIMISEATKNLLEDKFVVRRLDKVRVVNVNTPIRLYELICEKHTASDSLLKYYADWELAKKLFEGKKYSDSLSAFKALYEENSDDNVTAYYIKLIENFFIKGAYPTEQDDFGVAFNPEDGVFKLLQK